MLGAEVQAVAHLDSLEKVLRRVEARELEEILARLVRRLVRMKALDGWRVSDRLLLAVDGTGLYSFRERHCKHCVETRHPSGAVTYSHKLLVAFIVSADGYALPVACEFIENPGETYVKQDCETKAFHRLEPKLKRLFPQTPFWLLLDALYADQKVMRACLANGWNFAVTFKESDMPALWREAQSLLALSPGQRSVARTPDKPGEQVVRWVNDLDYEGMRLSAVFQEEPEPGGEGTRKFAHLVGRTVDRDNCWRTAAAGRQRWRCENEGFNTLKRGGFALEHAYSRNPVAAKGYLVLMLIAHIVQQLLARGRLGNVFGEVFHTFRNYGRKLLEALRDLPLPAELHPPGQIRLSTA
jgi:hypothetical protein